MRLSLLFTCVLALASTASAQNYLELGLKAGVINYQGDLQDKLFTASGSRPAFGAMLRYSYGEKFALRAMVEAGNISADDKDNSDPQLVARGFSFESSLLTAELVAEWLPFGKERMSNGIFLSQINPYGLLGIGYARINAEVTTLNPADAQRFPEADDRSNFFTVPIGAGLRWDIASGLAIGAEANWRATFSDYVDGVSVNGRADREDWFWTAGGYVSFTFGGNDDEMNLK